MIPLLPPDFESEADGCAANLCRAMAKDWRAASVDGSIQRRRVQELKAVQVAALPGQSVASRADRDSDGPVSWRASATAGPRMVRFSWPMAIGGKSMHIQPDFDKTGGGALPWAVGSG